MVVIRLNLWIAIRVQAMIKVWTQVRELVVEKRLPSLVLLFWVFGPHKLTHVYCSHIFVIV
jgi:hypothetical protein